MGGLVLLAACFVYSATWSGLAPGGRWTNEVLGFELWQENDPGGWYLASAHELLSRPGQPLFAGHPGLPLQLQLAGVQYAAYALTGGAERGLTFTEATARRLELVWWLAKLSVTAVHLAAVICLFAFAREILGSDRAAAVAALVYATSLPFLYFISRVSAEPWVVLCFCLTFSWLWRHEAAVATGAHTQALGWAALAGATASLGALAKMHLLAPFPLFCLIPLALAHRGDRVPSRARTWRWAAVVYVLVALVPILASVLLVDWHFFVRYWIEASTAGHGTPQVSAAAVVTERLRAAITGFSPSAFLPRASREGVFSLAEWPLLFLGSGGVVLIARRPSIRGRFVWPASYAMLTLLVSLLRDAHAGWAGFHYLFLFVVVLAVATGQVGDHVLARLPPGTCRWHRWAAPILAVLVLHSVAMWVAVDSRMRDAARYGELRLGELYRSVAGLGSGERVLVVGPVPQLFHGLSDSYAPEGRTSSLIAEIEDRLVVRATPPRDVTHLSKLERRHRVTRVLDLTVARPTCISVGQAKAALGGSAQPRRARGR